MIKARFNKLPNSKLVSNSKRDAINSLKNFIDEIQNSDTILNQKTWKEKQFLQWFLSRDVILEYFSIKCMDGYCMCFGVVLVFVAK